MTTTPDLGTQELQLKRALLAQGADPAAVGRIRWICCWRAD